jgi:protein AaeX
MLGEVDVLGAFVPAIAIWLIACLALFLVLDLLLAKAGFYRLFWHAALVRVALFVCVFCAGGLASSAI